MNTYNILKRTVDISLSVTAIVVTVPLQIIIAVLLLLELKEFPFFFQERGLTLNKFRFTILKFRTIRSTKSRNEKHIYSRDIFLMPSLAVSLTPFAKLLRKTGLDELPQIYNVLLGQMSFVGPRPLMIQDLEIMKKEFPKRYKMREIIKSKPGITGVWQTIGDRTLGVENLIGLDLFYEEKKSSGLDAQILLSTIPFVLFAKNSDAIIPRVDFISKFFSFSLGEFKIEHRKRSSGSKGKSNSYTLKIPLNWWYTSDSYSIRKKSEPKIIHRIESIERKRKSL